MPRSRQATPLSIGWFLLVFLAFFPSVGATGLEDNSHAQIVGTWRGRSVCQVQNSPCHDEVNIYRFSEIKGKPGRFSCTASKIVNGQEVVMGEGGEWTYDPEKRILESSLPGATIRFTLDGDTLDGTLTLRDNTVYRRIHLKKDHQNTSIDLRGPDQSHSGK